MTKKHVKEVFQEEREELQMQKAQLEKILSNSAKLEETDPRFCGYLSGRIVSYREFIKLLDYIEQALLREGKLPWDE